MGLSGTRGRESGIRTPSFCAKSQNPQKRPHAKARSCEEKLKAASPAAWQRNKTPAARYKTNCAIFDAGNGVMAEKNVLK
jgi:hypothetical protein